MNNQVIISTDTGLGNSSCIFSAPWEFRQAAWSTYRDLVQTVAVYKRGKQMVDAYRPQNKEVNITISSFRFTGLYADPRAGDALSTTAQETHLYDKLF